MCFSPKIKTPSVQANIPAPEASPLSEQPTGVEFGGANDDDNKDSGLSSEVSGRKDLKVSRGSSKAAIKSKAFNK